MEIRRYRGGCNITATNVTIYKDKHTAELCKVYLKVIDKQQEVIDKLLHLLEIERKKNSNLKNI